MYQTDVLIIGTGPAGSSAALLCSTYGIPNMVVNKYRWLAHNPRAHIVSQRTMEVIHDLGIAADVIQKASPLELMGNIVFCTGIAGEELGRLPYGGNRASRQSDYTIASPYKQCDLPQHLFEPILLSHAASRGSHVKFDTEYLDHEQDADGVTVRLMDRLTHIPFFVRAKYLLGADGGNSKVAEDIQLPMEGKMGLAGSISVILNADLSKYVAHRPGLLWWVLQPGSNVGGIGMGLLRMVRPWNEWQIVWGYDINDGTPELTKEMGLQIARQLIGDNDIPIDIVSMSTWGVNQQYAARYSKGRVFCLGDAVHRHPPTNGLGSNTSIQDAYNLVWKLALVLKGKAAPSLLESYGIERSPTGKHVIHRSNKSIREFGPIFEALGLTNSEEVTKMKDPMKILKEDSPAGALSREKLRKAIEFKSYEFATHGIELNIRYDSSAIVQDGRVANKLSRDPELYCQPSTFPGNRLPHVWFNQNGKEISSLAITGKGKFVLFTGIGGEKWAAAANYVSKELHIPIDSYIIGPGRDLLDLYGDWAERREVGEDACILVRPDAHVMWRSMENNNEEAQLLNVFKKALGLH